MNETLEQARALLENAQRIVAVTGAGISAESGVPTFRGPKGLWKSYRPEELATAEAFARDPQTVWEWYGWRRELIATCSPNPAHLALARLALDHPEVAIITQNVDGLHTRAAKEEAGHVDFSPALPIELHGSINRDRCSACDSRQPGSPVINVTSIDTLPHCDRCSAFCTEIRRRSRARRASPCSWAASAAHNWMTPLSRTSSRRPVLARAVRMSPISVAPYGWKMRSS